MLGKKRARVSSLTGQIQGTDWPAPNTQDTPDEDALTAALSGVLAPAAPPSAFRAELARDLAAVARQKASPQIILQRPPRYRRGFVIGAAVSSAVSVASLIAFFLNRHSHRATNRSA